MAINALRPLQLTIPSCLQSMTNNSQSNRTKPCNPGTSSILEGTSQIGPSYSLRIFFFFHEIEKFAFIVMYYFTDYVCVLKISFLLSVGNLRNSTVSIKVLKSNTNKLHSVTTIKLSFLQEQKLCILITLSFKHSIFVLFVT